VRRDPGLAKGLNVAAGVLRNDAVAADLAGLLGP